MRTTMSDPDTRILTTLKNSERDLSIKEIAERTGLNRMTVGKWLGILQERQEVIKTREVGRAKFYDTPEE